jgi:hypothetical protein
MLITKLGIVMIDNGIHSGNHFSLMDVTGFGIIIYKDLHQKAIFFN